MPKEEYWRAEAFLKSREKFCVGASSRFLRIRESRGHVWRLDGEEGKIPALLLHSGHSLFPVFGNCRGVPCPRFLNRFLGKARIHSVQGLREDAETLERLMESQGRFASERIDYDLMGLDAPPSPESLRAGPAGLALRPPFPEDEDALFFLQAAYEREEVLPQNAEFNPAACRINLRHILSRERILLAEMGGEIVGKINTSAESFTRRQIGGVYIRPDRRGLGIGTRMAAAFVRDLLARGQGVTLFVKKRNAPAKAVYRKLGFGVLGDYRITYF